MAGLVTVVGSYNVGLFLKGGSIPRAGETLIGESFYESGGGKGSNQAIAARRMGADVVFVGRLGRDRYGDDALALYRRLGMRTDSLAVDDEAHTGVSVILVDASGNNSIMVVPGSNYRLDRADIDRAYPVLADSAIVGFQLENRLDAVCYGIARAHAAGARVLLDPAPAAQLPDCIYPMLDYIKPNEVEAAEITGVDVHDCESAMRAGALLVARGVRNAIITLGAAGAVLVNRDVRRSFSIPALAAPVVDTTGAGDCFSGALMAELARGVPVEQAIELAICASALSTTRLGVVEALPERAEAAALLKAQRGREAT